MHSLFPIMLSSYFQLSNLYLSFPIFSVIICFFFLLSFFKFFLVHCIVDDGSTGMEVAIKMAMRLYDKRLKSGKIKNHRVVTDSTDAEDLVEENMKNIVVLTQRDCYHGNI